MIKQVFILKIITLLCLANAAPTDDKVSEKVAQNHSDEEKQFVDPRAITIEYLETLLRRASGIFRPTAEQQTAVPHKDMQPPANLPFNFYLPLYDHEKEDEKWSQLDEKSRKMKMITPPPLCPIGPPVETNYNYVDKPKRSPKKFESAAKLVNIKWLNHFEKHLSSSGSTATVDIPKAAYLMDDERNRINFDDSFFAVDMQVPLPDAKHDGQAHSSTYNDYPERREQPPDAAVSIEDLIAAAAVEIPFISIALAELKGAKLRANVFM